MSEAERIARGLTTAQRKWLPVLVNRGFLEVSNTDRPGCINSAAALSLVNALLARRAYFEVFTTSLGEAVATALRAQEGPDA